MFVYLNVLSGLLFVFLIPISGVQYHKPAHVLTAPMRQKKDKENLSLTAVLQGELTSKYCTSVFC